MQKAVRAAVADSLGRGQLLLTKEARAALAADVLARLLPAGMFSEAILKKVGHLN